MGRSSWLKNRGTESAAYRFRSEKRSDDRDRVQRGVRRRWASLHERAGFRAGLA